MASGGSLEWRVNVGDGATEVLRPEGSFVGRMVMGVKGFVWGLFVKGWMFLEKAWGIANSEPKKAVHGLKVGLALSIVSVFYYMRPLYEGIGGNAMWAIMTVVVTFESTVGATFYKCVNRVIGTSLAGGLGIGVHWVAAESGDRFEPIVLGISLFLLASATTFSRFIPSIKTKFDYGAMIFILTFCLVSISSYRVDKLFELAHTRLTTIAIGTSLCIIVSMLFCPMWAGSQLHSLVFRNLDKLADGLDGCLSEYFKNVDDPEMENEDQECHDSKAQSYKCVLNSKASEESMANFARWEPAHGRFGFRHPWKKYLEVGVAMRKCAYCIEALHDCLNSEIKAPNSLKLLLLEPCKALSTSSSKVLKELSIVIKTMKKSTKIDLEVSDMNIAVQELQAAIASFPSTQTANEEHEAATIPPLMELLPLATLVSLLIETASRIEHVVNAVETLANVANFDSEEEKKRSCLDNNDHHVAMRVFPEA
ncbi:aluminum-activated malate transporter 10 [Cucurbita pepo subsp. pepo]|uniref:aluminum-activated malate transporter 10 n=1 Tax=Cucurbita pepo subsp. pepo TaxID=3664 RepID=UPI000C9DA4C1|nr:aluminum-activated malate transporter 10 [Cucurbita pepo subsp. pepo]